MLSSVDATSKPTVDNTSVTKETTMSITTSSNLETAMMTIDQAAEYLAIPKATLYTWRTRRVGFGPRAVKMGACLHYRRVDLDMWIDRHLEATDEQYI